MGKIVYKKVTHVIFDLDGLILETESMYEKTISEIGNLYGKIYTNSMKIEILGTPEKDTAKIAIKLMDLPISIDEFLKLFRDKMCEKFQNDPQFMPGVIELIKHLNKNNIPIAIATSSTQIEYDLKTAKYQEIFQLFHHVVCGGTDPDVKVGKPAPDIFLVCAQRFPDKPKPENCLVLEDAPNGVKGAIDAGMQAVLVPDPIVPTEKRQLATLVLDTLENFKPQLFGLPSF